MPNQPPTVCYDRSLYIVHGTNREASDTVVFSLPTEVETVSYLIMQHTRQYLYTFMLGDVKQAVGKQ
jgi:hypothetical protein